MTKSPGGRALPRDIMKSVATPQKEPTDRLSNSTVGFTPTDPTSAGTSTPPYLGPPSPKHQRLTNSNKLAISTHPRSPPASNPHQLTLGLGGPKYGRREKLTLHPHENREIRGRLPNSPSPRISEFLLRMKKGTRDVSRAFPSFQINGSDYGSLTPSTSSETCSMISFSCVIVAGSWRLSDLLPASAAAWAAQVSGFTGTMC